MAELGQVINELEEKKLELVQVCNEAADVEAPPPRGEAPQSGGFDKPKLSETERLNTKPVMIIKSSKSSSAASASASASASAPAPAPAPAPASASASAAQPAAAAAAQKDGNGEVSKKRRVPYSYQLNSSCLLPPPSLFLTTLFLAIDTTDYSSANPTRMRRSSRRTRDRVCFQRRATREEGANNFGQGAVFRELCDHSRELGTAGRM